MSLGPDDRPGRVVHWLPLAHHHLDHAGRCVHLPLGSLRVALCARCLGLYPVLFACLVVQALSPERRLGALDHAIALGAALPGLLDWGAGLLRSASGTNLRRVLTGALLGVALGRSFWLYFNDPMSEVFWLQALLLAMGAGAFMALRSARAAS